MVKKILLVMFLLLMLIFSVGCFDLKIENNVKYPKKLFKKTRAHIDRIANNGGNRSGLASEMKFVVYMGDEGRLIQFGIKREMAGMMFKVADKHSGVRMEKYLGKKGKFHLMKPDDIFKLGPGLLLEASVADEDISVLVWLE